MNNPSQHNQPLLPPEGQWGMMKANPLGGSKPFDLLTDALIPLCILGMVGSFAYFLVEVRSALTRMGDEVLRWVFFWFLLGVVCISRIRTKYGSDAIAAPYIVGLAFAMAVFLLRFTGSAGSLTGSGISVLNSLLFNFALVGVAWWAINKLTDECTAEEGVADETGSGLLGRLFKSSAANENGQPTRGRVRHPGRLVMLFGLGALVVFGLTQRHIANDAEAMRRGFYWMAGYAFCSLAVLALTSLSGLRIYVKKRGVTLSRGVAPLWISISALIIACILLVASLIPRTSTDIKDLSKMLIARGTPTTQEIQTDSSLEGVRQPKGQPTKLKRLGEGEGHVGEDNPQPSRTGESPQQTPQGSSGAGKPSEGASGTKGSTAKGAGTAGQAGAGQGGQGKSQNQSKSARSGGGGASEQSQNQNSQQQNQSQDKSSSNKPSFSLKSGFPWWLLLLLLLLLIILYLLWKNRDKIKRQLTKLRNVPAMVREWWAAMAARMAALWARLLALLHLPSWSKRVAAAPVKRKKFTNPFANKRLLEELSPKEVVEYAYTGLLDYAEYIRCPRKEHQTPYEYARLLPQPLEHLKEEVVSLTQLYVQASYTPQEITREHLRDVERVWDKLNAEMQAVMRRS
jgi:hypothetical protein